jgi:ketopantoate reductase
MLLDLENETPLKIDVILGNLLVRARELGVSVSIMGCDYEMLKLGSGRGSGGTLVLKIARNRWLFLLRNEF